MLQSNSTSPTHEDHPERPMRLGVWLSIACAVHCAALPLLAVLLPALTSGFLASPLLDLSLMGLSFGMGAFFIYRGYTRHHHQWTPAILLASGFAVFVIAHLLGHDAESWEHGFAAAAGILAGAAQILNIRLVRRMHSCAAH